MCTIEADMNVSWDDIMYLDRLQVSVIHQTRFVAKVSVPFI
jgi:hypothetical protein